MGIPAINVKIVASLAELKKALAAGTGEIVVTSAALKKMSTSLSGDNLVQHARNMAAAIQNVGGVSKLTESELARANRVFDAAAQKLALMGKAGDSVTQEFQRLATATKAVEAPLSTTDQLLGKIWSGLKSAAGLIGIAFSARAVIGFVGSVFDAASNIHDMSLKLGISAEAAQRFKFAAEQSGAELDDVGRAINFMNKALVVGDTSTVKALANAGLEFSKIRAMKPEDAFNAIAAAVKDIPDPMLQAQVAAELFSKSALALLPGIKEGFVDIGKSATVMSNETVASLEKAQDAWQALADKVVIISGTLIAHTMSVTSQMTKSWGDFANFVSDALQHGFVYAGAMAKAASAQGELTDKQKAFDAAFAATLARQTGAVPIVNSLTTAHGAHAKAVEQATIKIGDNQKSVDAIELAMQRWMRTTDSLNAKSLPTMYGNLEAINIKLAAGIPLFYSYGSGMAEIDIEALAVAGKLDVLLGSMSQLPAEAAPAVQAVGTAFAAIGSTLDILNTSIAGTFAQMALHAKGFKDGFIDIWHSIQGALAKIFTDILGDFTNRLLKGMLAAMKGGSFSSAFAGMFTGGGSGAGGLIGGLFGGGGAAAGTLLPGAAIGTTGAVTGGAISAGGAGAGLGAGGTAAGVGAGIGMGAMIGATAGIGAAALLAWAIWKKGLFRGGEESLKVNKPRDQYLQDFETGGSRAVDMTGTAPGGVGSSLAGQLTVAGAGAGGGALMQAIFKADTVKEWNAAVANAEAALQKFKDTQDATAKATDAAMAAAGQYGLTWEDMSDKIQQSTIGTLSTSLLADVAALQGAGVSQDVILKGMAGSFQELYNSIQRTGEEIPAELQPTIDKLLEMGLILDADGLKAKAAADALAASFAVSRKAAIDSIKALEDEQASLMQSISNEAPEEQMGVIEGITRDRIALLAAEAAKQQAALDDSTAVAAAAIKVATDEATEGFARTDIGIKDVDASTGELGVAIDVNKDKWRTWRDDVVKYAGDALAAVNSVTWGKSPGGIKEWEPRLEGAGLSFEKFSETARRALDPVFRETKTLADQVSAIMHDALTFGPGDLREFEREGLITAEQVAEFIRRRRGLNPLPDGDRPPLRNEDPGRTTDPGRSESGGGSGSSAGGGSTTYSIDIHFDGGGPQSNEQADKYAFVMAEKFIDLVDHNTEGLRTKSLKAHRLTATTGSR